MRHSIHSLFYDQASAHEAEERYDAAIALYYQVHRWAPEDPDLWLRLGVLSFLMSDRDWLEKRELVGSHLADMGFVNAELYLARAAALAPHEARYAFWHGWVRHALYQDAEGAQAELSRALALDSHHPYAHAALARMAIVREDFATALEHLAPAIAALPESARLHYDTGACLVRCGAEAAARAAFTRALACESLPLGEGAS
ncbi:MAG TPA: tetratricopeptide repeat protein, partial [Oscillatoriaceae cyanobacterium]